MDGICHLCISISISISIAKLILKKLKKKLYSLSLSLFLSLSLLHFVACTPVSLSEASRFNPWSPIRNRNTILWWPLNHSSVTDLIEWILAFAVLSGYARWWWLWTKVDVNARIRDISHALFQSRQHRSGLSLSQLFFIFIWFFCLFVGLSLFSVFVCGFEM